MADEIETDTKVDLEDEVITLVHDDIATRLAAYRRSVGAVDGGTIKPRLVVIPETEDPK